MSSSLFSWEIFALVFWHRTLSESTDDVCGMQGPILAFVYAVKEMLKEGRSRNGSLPVNVAFVFEGEEENGSAGFREAVQANLHWFEGTQLIIISNTLWVGEEVGPFPASSYMGAGFTAPFSYDGMAVLLFFAPLPVVLFLALLA